MHQKGKQISKIKLENLYACNSKSTKKAGQVWRKKGEVMKLKNLNPTVKHGGGVFVCVVEFLS